MKNELFTKRKEKKLIQKRKEKEITKCYKNMLVAGNDIGVGCGITEIIKLQGNYFLTILIFCI
jgi:hypothetical protein